MKKISRYLSAVIASQFMITIVVLAFHRWQASLQLWLLLSSLLLVLVFVNFIRSKFVQTVASVVGGFIMFTFWYVIGEQLPIALDDGSLIVLGVLVINTITCIVLFFSDREFVGIKNGMRTERPQITKTINQTWSVCLAFLECPLILLLFCVDSPLKLGICTIVYLGGTLSGALVGDWSANTLRKQFRQIEERELREQLKREEGLR